MPERRMVGDRSRQRPVRRLSCAAAVYNRLMDASSVPVPVPERVADPVCGKRVDPGKTMWFIHHGDRTFYMCSLSCALRFQSNPDGFAAAAGTERDGPPA